MTSSWISNYLLVLDPPNRRSSLFSFLLVHPQETTRWMQWKLLRLGWGWGLGLGWGAMNNNRMFPHHPPLRCCFPFLLEPLIGLMICVHSLGYTGPWKGGQVVLLETGSVMASINNEGMRDWQDKITTRQDRVGEWGKWGEWETARNKEDSWWVVRRTKPTNFK